MACTLAVIYRDPENLLVLHGFSAGGCSPRGFTVSGSIPINKQKNYYKTKTKQTFIKLLHPSIQLSQTNKTLKVVSSISSNLVEAPPGALLPHNPCRVYPLAKVGDGPQSMDRLQPSSIQRKKERKKEFSVVIERRKEQFSRFVRAFRK